MVRGVEKELVGDRPQIKRITVDTENAWEELELKAQVVLVSGSREVLFRVERLEERRVTLRVISEAPPGKRWSFKRVPYGDDIQVGDALCRKVSSTNKTLRLEKIEHE